MRNIFISLLLASAAASPALAAPRDSSDRQSSREDRQAARQDRQSSREDTQTSRDDRQAARQERAQAQTPAREQRAPAAQPSVSAQQRDAMRADLRAQPAQRVNDRQANRDTRVDQRREKAQQNHEYFQQIREARRNARPPVISRTPQPNTQPPLPVTSRPTIAPQWNSSWRNNSRYNWSDYRRHHHWLFNLGFYSDPFGWGYQPYRTGWRMWPSYFSSNYWMNDPWQYRLPYAPPGTRWIRYYDDAILVDTWGGQVVDVIYDFFW